MFKDSNNKFQLNDEAGTLYGQPAMAYQQQRPVSSEGLILDPEKPSILLHACCGPCATACVERLAFNYSVVVFYYNPNIMDSDEYFKRRKYLLKFLKEFNEEYKDRTHVAYIEGRYEPEEFIKRAEPLKDEPEGGRRCSVCFEMRLRETADKADELGIDYFATTMAVSPHKNYNAIKSIGESLSRTHSCQFHDENFRKKDGFLRSIQLSKKHGLYRQKFCGCEYARAAQREYEAKKRGRDKWEN